MRVVLAAAAAAALTAACQPNSEKTNPPVATSESRMDRAETAPAAGANSFTEEQARDHAMKAGYSDVGALTQAADGTWQGAAKKNGASVTVVVDYQGNVTTRGGSSTMTPGTDTGPTPSAPSPSGATPSTPAPH